MSDHNTHPGARKAGGLLMLGFALLTVSIICWMANLTYVGGVLLIPTIVCFVHASKSIDQYRRRLAKQMQADKRKRR